MFQIDCYTPQDAPAYNKVIILGPSKLQWVDTSILNLGLDNAFKREIGKSTKYFLNGENVLNKQQIPSKPFRRGSIDKTLLNNFITLDIETVNINGNQTPYLICAYSGKSYIESYAKSTSASDQLSLFHNFISQLLSDSFLWAFGQCAAKAKKLTIYAHNLANFDGILSL